MTSLAPGPGPDRGRDRRVCLRGEINQVSSLIDVIRCPFKNKGRTAVVVGVKYRPFARKIQEIPYLLPVPHEFSYFYES